MDDLPSRGPTCVDDYTEYVVVDELSSIQTMTSA